MGAPRQQLMPLSLPADLVALPQWVLWRAEKRDGKPTKIPYQISGQRAETNNPATWTAYDATLNVLQNAPQRYTGIGFVFGPTDPFLGIDLDDCLGEDGALRLWAVPIVERFAGTYMEVSPSGRGVKIWVRGVLQGTGRAASYQDGRVEIYDRGRFFTTTGNAFNGAPLTVNEHQQEVLWLIDLISHGGTARQKKATSPHTLFRDGPTSRANRNGCHAH